MSNQHRGRIEEEPARPRGQAIGVAVGVAGLYLACSLIAPHIRLPLRVALVVSPLLFTGLSLVLAMAVVAVEAETLRWLALMVISGEVWALGRLGEPLGPIADLALIFMALCFGRLLSRLIREANLLLPILVVIAVVDLWGVYFGPVAQAVEHRPGLVETMSARLPTFGPAAPGQPAMPVVSTVGIGDFVFLAVLLACVQRFHLNLRGTLGWVFVLIWLPLIAVPVFGVRLPGLLFIGLAGVVANFRHFRFTREEKTALLYGSGALGLVLGLLWVLWQRVMGGVSG